MKLKKIIPLKKKKTNFGEGLGGPTLSLTNQIYNQALKEIGNMELIIDVEKMADLIYTYYRTAWHKGEFPSGIIVTSNSVAKAISKADIIRIKK